MNRSIALSLITLLSIAPSLTAPAVAQSNGSAIAQAPSTQEIDAAIEEGMKLFKAGSAESLRKAISQFEQALGLARSANAKNQQSLALLVLGRIHDLLGEKQKTIEYYNQALPIFRAVGDRSGEATTLNNLGMVYNDLGEKQKAIEYYNQALPIFRTVGIWSGEATTLNNLGLIYDSLGEKQKAIECYRQALFINRTMGNQSDEARVLANLGFIYDSLGEKQKAIEYYNQALAILRAVSNQSLEATTLNNLGGAYDSLGKNQKAIEYYNRALAIRREVGDRSGEATTLNNLGVTYYSLGEKQRAIEYFNQALPILRTVGNRSVEARTLNNLGSLYDSLGEKQKAIEYYNQSLSISLVLGDRSVEATTLNNLGILHDSLGEKQKAIKYYSQALPLLRAVGNRLVEATTLNNLGAAYDDLDEKQKTIEYYNRALAIRHEVGDRLGEATTLNNLGFVYYSLGEQQQAIDFYYQALPIIRAVGNRSGEASTLNNLGFLLASQKNPDLAIAFFKQSVNIHESLRKDIRKLPRETQEIYTSSVAKTYRKLADLLLRQNRAREAQVILELLKVQENQEFENGQTPNVPLIQFPTHPLEAQALQTFEKSIAANQPFTLESLQTMGQPLNENRDRITQDMNRQEIAIGNPKAILQANPNAIFIQNLVVENTFWVIWTNANGITKTIAVPNLKTPELTQTVNALQQDLKDPRSDLKKLQATSQKLYNWLIPPELQTELQQTPKQQLIFSLDHVTRNIPIAALHDGTQYLTQRYSLTNLITTDTNMTDRLSNDHTQILALGTSKFYPGFNPLPNVPAELNAIVRTDNNQGLFPGKIHLNEDFIADRLTQNLDNYSILHIATHGVFNPKTITASYLLLGNGDRLPLTNIASLNPLKNTHLIVLSACQTGITGSGQEGTEISGISHYFLRRGAKSVLASLWNVNDGSTALMMQQFYQRLAQANLTKSQAIQQVQQAFISGKLTQKDIPTPPKNTPANRSEILPPTTDQTPRKMNSNDFSHPYYWAPFILIGNNQ